MWRGLLAVTACLSATSVQAQTLNLPAMPGPSAVATINGGGPTVELRLPADYDTIGGPFFGTSGNLDGNLAIIGSPEAFGDGAAFIFDATTGAETQRLFAGEPLGGGTARPQFGTTVDLYDGLAVVTAPLAGADMFGVGVAFVFNANTGQKVQSIWGPGNFTHIVDAILGPGYVDLTLENYGDQSLNTLRVSIVPEPSAVLLTALGLLATNKRRRP